MLVSRSEYALPAPVGSESGASWTEIPDSQEFRAFGNFSRLSVDPLSEFLFCRRKPCLVGSSGLCTFKVLEGLAYLTGRDLSTEDVGRLIGAPGGSILSLYSGPNMDGKQVFEFTTQAALKVPYECLNSSPECNPFLPRRKEKRVEIGFKLEIANHLESSAGRSAELRSFQIDPMSSRRRGIGARIFAQMASGLAFIGVNEISLWAEDDNANGYYTWPRLGFNMKIPAYLHPLMIHDGLPAVDNTHDLFKEEGGAAWWKEYGERDAALFDLRPGSESWVMLNNYLQSRGISLPSRPASLTSSDADVSASK